MFQVQDISESHLIYTMYKMSTNVTKVTFKIDLLRWVMIRTVENSHGLLRDILPATVIRISPLPPSNPSNKNRHVMSSQSNNFIIFDKLSSQPMPLILLIIETLPNQQRY